MMKVEIISSDIIIDTPRLEAKYFLDEYATNARKVERSPFKKLFLTEVSRVFNPPVFKRQFCSPTDRAVPYYQSSDVTSMSEGSDIFIHKTQAEKLKVLVDANWILITGFGSIGNVKLTSTRTQGTAYANNVCRVVPNGIVPYGYLYAFLSSKYGVGQINKNASGSVVRYIEAPGIRKTIIPILPDNEQQSIHAAIETVARLRVEADKLLSEAEAQLLENLGLDTDTYKRLTSASERDTAAEFVVSSAALSARTIRARNYAKRLREIVVALTVSKHDALVDVLHQEPYYTGRFKRLVSTAASAVELFSQGDIFALKPKGQMISPRTVPTSGKALTEKGTILVAGVGTLGENEIFGRAKFVWGYLEDKLVAQHIIRFEPNEQLIDSGYLFAVLNSKLWFRILRSSVCGTNLLGFIVPMLNEMPVPRFDKATEDAIGQRVKTAYEKLTEANKCEAQAIARVEELVGSW